MKALRIILKILGFIMILVPLAGVFMVLAYFAEAKVAALLMGIGIAVMLYIALGMHLIFMPINIYDEVDTSLLLSRVDELDAMVNSMNSSIEEIEKLKEDVNSLSALKVPTRREQVASWQEGHPEGTKKQCARDTGIPKSTVYKYWVEPSEVSTYDSK